MSAEWPMVKVSDVCELIVDCVNKTAPTVDFVTPYKMIRTTNIRDGRLKLADCKYVTQDVYEIWTRRAKVVPGDVLLTREAPLGEVAIIREPDTVFLGQRIIQYRANRAVLHPGFLFYAFRSPPLRSQFLVHSGSGSVVDHIRVPDCLGFKIPLPPLPEQEEIAEILGALDDKIELNRKTSQTLESLAQTLFQSWFVDFDPVHAKAQGRPPMCLDGKTAELFPHNFIQSEIGRIPEGWSPRTLGALLSVIETGSRPKGGVTEITEGVPSIGAESITRIGEHDHSKTKYVPRAFFDSMRRGHVEPNDVLLYKDGGRPGAFEPKVSMSGEGFPFTEMCINEHVYRLRTNDELAQSFLYLLLSCEPMKEEMRRRGTGVAIPGLNSTAVRALPVLVPPRMLIHKFDELVTPYLQAILRNSLQNRLLADIRETLLPRLLSGEISVKETESTLAAGS